MLDSYYRMKNDLDTSLEELGTLIMNERKARGLTQTQLGELSGASINFISQIEAGKPTAQIGKVFQVLQLLGFEVHLQRGPNGLILPRAKK